MADVAELMDEPADGIADLVERRRAEEAAGVLPAAEDAPPAAYRVAVQDEALRGLLEAQAQHFGEHEDLRAVVGEDPRAALGSDGLDPATLDRELTLQEADPEVGLVELSPVG